MSSSQRIQVLEKYRPFARCLAAFNIENFSVTDRRLFVHNLLRAIAIATLLASLVAFVYLSKLYSSFAQENAWNERAYQLAAVLCLTQQFVIYVLLAIKHHEIIGALNHVQKIVDSRHLRQSHRLYQQVEHRYSSYLDKISKAFAAASSTYVLPLLQPLSYVIFKHPDPSQWTLPHEFQVPFTGYVLFSVGWLFLLFCAIAYCLFIFISLMYFVGMCLYVSAMMEDLAASLNDFDESFCVELAKHGSSRISYHQAVVNYIRFHSEIINSANIVEDTMSVLIFFQMLFSATELASFLFAIDETKGMDLMNGTAILGGWTILMPTYLFCQLSENVSVSMQMISDAFYGCAWYCLSAKQQTLFLLPMQRAQKEIRINGLGIVDCSLAVFASIIRTTSSYFLLLRSF